MEIIGVGNLTVVELLAEHCRVLRGRGYEPIHGDFLTADLDGPFDRIVMNPPFEGRQDVRHVAHAFDLLAPGGRLVAVMAEGVTYRDDRATKGIRALVDAHGSVTTHPARSFAAFGTDIATVTVLLDKPAAPFAGAAGTAGPAIRADAIAHPPPRGLR